MLGFATDGHHANVAAVAPHNPGFQTIILPGSPGYALYPSAQVAQNDGLETGLRGAYGREKAWIGFVARGTKRLHYSTHVWITH